MTFVWPVDELARFEPQCCRSLPPSPRHAEQAARGVPLQDADEDEAQWDFGAAAAGEERGRENCGQGGKDRGEACAGRDRQGLPPESQHGCVRPTVGG